MARFWATLCWSLNFPVGKCVCQIPRMHVQTKVEFTTKPTECKSESAIAIKPSHGILSHPFFGYAKWNINIILFLRYAAANITSLSTDEIFFYDYDYFYEENGEYHFQSIFINKIKIVLIKMEKKSYLVGSKHGWNEKNYYRYLCGEIFILFIYGIACFFYILQSVRIKEEWGFLFRPRYSDNTKRFNCCI